MIQELINRMYLMYEWSIEKLAKEEFERVVKPFCKQHCLTFGAGNGTYYVGKGLVDGRVLRGWSQEDYREDAEWQSVAKILEIDIPGMNQCLGSLMPNMEVSNEKG